MHESIFLGLSVVIVIATIMALIMRLIRQPLIIGYILTGIIVGPAMLHLLKSADTIQTFSNIGIALLLFIIGLGLNPRVVREVGKVAVVVGIVQVALVVLLGLGAGEWLGLGYRESVFLGTALAFSSTIITLKLLSDKKEQNRLYGKITIGILIIQDLMAAIALLFVTSQGNSSNVSLGHLAVLSLKGVLVTVIFFLVGRKVLPRLKSLIAGSQEFLFLFAIAWGFGCAALFQEIGLSLEIGALIGGIALSALPFAQEISSRLRPLRDFFIVVFFISLGSRLNVSTISHQLPLIILASLIVIFIKPLIVMLTMGISGYTKQTSLKTAISLGQVSEFSLVLIILGNATGIVSTGVVNAITIVALISIAVSAYLINYSDPIYRALQRYLAVIERSKIHTDRASNRYRYDLVLFGYRKGGQEFLKLFQSLHKKFVVVDYDPEVIEIMERQAVNCIYGDATDVALLEEIGIEHTNLIVSTITDHDSNVFLLKLIEKINPKAIVIVHAESLVRATELYGLGASYVVVPHYIGNDNVAAFIRKSELKKSEFTKYQAKHLDYIKSHYASLV